MSELNNSKRIFGLDAMRAIAILMVLSSSLFWIYPSSPESSGGFISQILALFGFWGIEIFFVLSGFLMGNILYKLYIKDDFTIHSVFYFLKRRWFRILPNYFLILVLNIVIAIVIGNSISDIGYYFFLVQNFAAPMKPFFPESWSLTIAEFAYLFMPFALLIGTILVKPKNKSKRFIWIILVLILVFVINKIIYKFTTSNTSIEQWNASLKSIVIYRIDSVLIGILASWLSLNCANFWKKQKLILAFLGCMLMGLMFVGVGFFRILIDSHPFFWNVMYLPITSIAFALFLPILSQWKSAPLWFSKPVTFISIISYSIYLLHYGIVLQLMKYFVDTTLLSNFQLHLYSFSYIITTFFLSFLLYKCFEKPIMDWRDK